MVREVLAMIFFILLVLLAVTVIHGLLRAVQRRGARSGSCQPFMERRCSGKEPPVFSGKPLELAEWIFSMEEVLATIPSNEHVAFAVSYFTGDARRWFMSFTAESERARSWLALKEALELAFSPRAEKRHYLGQLLKARQNGTLEEYIESFRRLCLHAGAEASEVTRTLIFVEGLDHGLRKHVKLSQPENLQAAFQAARAIADLTPDMEGQSLSQAGASDNPQFSRNDGFGQSTLAASQAFGRRQYLVKWLGYQRPTWEPEVNLKDESGQEIVQLKDYLREIN